MEGANWDGQHSAPRATFVPWTRGIHEQSSERQGTGNKEIHEVSLMLELLALASSNKGLATKRYNTIVHLESFVFAILNKQQRNSL